MHTTLVAQVERRRPHARAVVALVGAAVLLISACGLVFPVERVERSRVASPDGRVEAVVVRTNAGATTSYGYNVYIVPAGGKPEEKRELLNADGLSEGELRVAWTAPRVLQISVGDARIYHYKNFWMSADVDEYDYVVKVRLDQSFAAAVTSPVGRAEPGIDRLGSMR